MVTCMAYLVLVFVQTMRRELTSLYLLLSLYLLFYSFIFYGLRLMLYSSWYTACTEEALFVEAWVGLL